MIAIVLFIVFKTNPPWGEVAVKSILPDNYGVLMLPMITLIGGVVGGYTSFSGAHRLLDGGIVGLENVRNVTHSATIGILIAGFMRTILFLAILGVVTGGVVLGKTNPMADAFQSAAGQFGHRLGGRETGRENQLRQLGSSGPDQARQPNDFTGTHLQAARLYFFTVGEVVDVETWAAEGNITLFVEQVA